MTGHEEAKSHPSCILNGFDTLRRQLTSAGSTLSRTAPSPSFARPLANTAIRNSWVDRVEECPVGFAGIAHAADAVVFEVGEPERDSFDAFGQVADGFGGPVGYV